MAKLAKCCEFKQKKSILMEQIWIICILSVPGKNETFEIKTNISFSCIIGSGKLIYKNLVQIMKQILIIIQPLLFFFKTVCVHKCKIF